VLTLGERCGLHRIDCLMRTQVLRARPRRRGLPKDYGERSAEHFRQLLKEQGITCSMSRAGEVWDNSAMKSFFSSVKTERTTRRVYRTREQARSDVFDYIERFYNPTLPHSALGYVSPSKLKKLSSVSTEPAAAR
jgi:putative transposase